MKWFANAYVQALGLFAVGQVIRDALKSGFTIIQEAAFVVVSVFWVALSPLLALVEVFRPGALDRLLFRLAR